MSEKVVTFPDTGDCGQEAEDLVTMQREDLREAVDSAAGELEHVRAMAELMMSSAGGLGEEAVHAVGDLLAVSYNTLNASLISLLRCHDGSREDGIERPGEIVV